MGYHATLPVVASSNSSENEISPSESNDVVAAPPQPGKYFLATGRDFPFCRKFAENGRLKHVFKFIAFLHRRTSLSIHHWIGKAENGRGMGSGLLDGGHFQRSWCPAKHWPDAKGNGPPGARLHLSGGGDESARFGRSHSKGWIELGARNERSRAAIVMSVLVQWSPVR